MFEVTAFDSRRPLWWCGDAPATPSDGVLSLSPGSQNQPREYTVDCRVLPPYALSEFAMLLRWSFAPGRGGFLVLALDRPHAWTPLAEAPWWIRVDRKGSVYLGDAATPCAQAATVKGALVLELRRRKARITLGGAGGEAVLPGPDGTGGGFPGLAARGTPVTVQACTFSLTSKPRPWNAEKRIADNEVWMRERAARNHEDYRRLAAEITAAEAAGTWNNRVSFDIEPGLLRPGESARISLHVRGERTEPCHATLEDQYLGPEPAGPEPLRLDWVSDGQGGWRAETDWTARRRGNIRVVWHLGNQRLVRVFGVAAAGDVVTTLWVGSNRPMVDALIHRYDLPGDYWVGDWWSPFGRAPRDVLDYLRPYAELRRRHGDRLVPFVNAQWLLPGIPNFNLFQVPEDVQTDALGLVQRLWNRLGIGPLEILGSYTFGHQSVRAARRLGIPTLNSLCVWQNWRDGQDDNHWKINHWGAPNPPYYAAGDDLRKVAPGRSVVASSMGTASSARNYSILTMEGCPTLTCPLRRYTGDTAQSVNIDRFYDAADGWLSDAEHQPEPLFTTVALENFAGSADWNRANELAVQYLVNRARRGRLVFSSAADIAAFYRRHYPRQPEQVQFQPDYYAGYRVHNKPARLPDRMELSNHQFHTVHCAGESLPQFFWDYTVPWQDPLWDPQPDLRDEYGLIPPERLTPETTIPRQKNLHGLRVEVSMTGASGTVALSLRFQAPKPVNRVPVAVWEVPLAPGTVSVTETAPSTRWLAVKDSITGNLHGLVICEDVPAGSSSRRLTLSGDPRKPRSAKPPLPEGIDGRISQRDGIPGAYLWRQDGTPPGLLLLRLPPNIARSVSVRYNDGTVETADESGVLRVRFSGDWRAENGLVRGMRPEDWPTNPVYEPSA